MKTLSLAFTALLSCSMTLTAFAGTSTWTGGGGDGRWQTPANWNTPPTAGDSLIFSGTTRLSNTNNFAAGTAFTGLTFNSPAGAFNLFGNSVALGGGITNNQVVVTETISLPLALTTTPAVNVVNGGFLTISGIISGGFGLTKVGGGTLTLGANNTFTGSLTVNAGTVSVSTDANLGAAPAAAAPGSLVLNNGTLRSTATFTINANRGIAVGPAAGSGSGALDVAGGTTLTYRGIIANNGAGAGGLTKTGFGQLIISGSNTYTGATLFRTGTNQLDFTQTTSPTNNVIHPASALTLGGANAGLGTLNHAMLQIIGRASTTNSQTFNGTFIDLGPALVSIAAGSGTGRASLALGALSHTNGGVVNFIFLQPTNTAVTTTSTNVNGLLGGWATIGVGATPVGGISVGTNWASVDGGGNIVPFTNFVVVDATDPGSTIVSNRESNVLLPHLVAFGSLPVNSTTITVTNPAGIQVGMHVVGQGIGTPTTVLSVSGNSIGINRTNGTALNNVAFAFGFPVTLNDVVTDVNTIKMQSSRSIVIPSGYTLRLGRFGGFFKDDYFVANTTSYIGDGTNQNVGNFTAGGGDNTPGEIVFTVNAAAQNNGSVNVDVRVTDNGTGAVSFVKNGAGAMKLRGNNTFSGGTYLLQGRTQLAGGEIGLSNPDAFGTGPIFVLPGAQIFGGGGTNSFTNSIFLAGDGTAAEPVGAMRLSSANVYSGTITLIGDARIGGGHTNTSAVLEGRITGPFDLSLGAAGNSGGSANGVRLMNQANDWTGDTIIVGRTGGSAGNTRVALGTNEVIPDGLGKGNVIIGLSGVTASICQLDLNGFNETINGLASAGTARLDWIYNSSNSTTSTLTLGNNDQSSTYVGVLMNTTPWYSPGGVLALTKIGAGRQTLGGTNTYTGDTTVNGGTLALSGSGSISNSANVYVNAGATLDVVGLTNGGFTSPNTVTLNGGTLAGNTSPVGITTLNATSSAFTLTLHPATTNIFAGTFATGGSTNLINITSLQGVNSYPTQFTVVKYGTLAGAGNNLVIGGAPSLSTQGYFSNDTAGLRLILVLTNGPKPLVWTGCTNTLWDVNATLNWLGFGVPSPFNTDDAVTFDDTACTGSVNVTTTVTPASIVVNNSILNYNFTGVGVISGFGGIVKNGTGSLTLANTGGNDFRGGIAVSNGTVNLISDNSIAGGTIVNAGTTVQVGDNTGTGNLPSGVVFNDGSLIFNRGADLTVAGVISGASAGSILKTNAGILTLSGANTFTGTVLVANGTLQAGNASALGRTNLGTTIASGATLDVNSLSLGFEPVTVEGAGVGGAGAIVNNGASGQNNALRTVTLTGNTTFGGTSRWDIRDTPAGALNATIAGGGFTLTKVGTNQMTLVGVSGASTLGDIIVQEGTFGLETATDLGSGTLSVSNGATLWFFNNSVVFNRTVSLAGNGVTPSVTINSGSVTIANPITIAGTALFSGTGTSLNANGGLQGGGSLVKIGSHRLSVTGPASYIGTTVISNGTAIFDGGKSGGAGISVEAGGALGGGGGTISENLTVNGGGLTPGNPTAVAQNSMVIAGNVTLNSSTNHFELSPNPVSGNDQLLVFSDLTLSGVNTFRISVIDHLTVGDVYTLVSYFGTGSNINTNTVQIIPPTFGYEFALVDPATTPGEIRIQVLVAIGFDAWLGNHPTTPDLWDNGITVNWLKAGVASVFTNGDFVLFSDFIPGFVSSSTNVLLATNLTTAGVIFTNSTAAPFHFVGPGGLQGGGLNLQGEGPVTIRNFGSNGWTGGSVIDFNAAVFFNPATLIVGDGSTNGNLGGGNLTNRGILVINRGGSIVISNNISGTGRFTNEGPGVVTLTGANTFTNTLHVLNGTMTAGSTNAFGNTTGVTLVTNTASLDVNGMNLHSEPVLVSGEGMGGQGAIVNNSTNAQTQALRFVTLAGDTTFGGNSRWDIRGTNAALLASPAATPFNLVKVGSNQVSLVGVPVIDSALNNIDIREGIFAVQTSTTQLGDPNGTITVRSNATLNVWDLTAAYLNKNLVLSNGATVWSDSGEVTNVGPVTLHGTVTILNDGGTTLRFDSNTVSGTGGLAKIGGGLTELAGTVTYSGSTVISNGTLALIGAASLAGSPVINLTNPAILDVSARTDGTLTIGGSRLLKGSGTIRGNVAINAGGTLAPGQGTGNLGALSITNALSLGGVAEMEIDATTGANDRTTNSASVTYGGSLVVSNVSGTLAAGQSFRLFAAGSYSGSFSSITLPPLSLPLYWTNTLSVNGRIAVATEIQPNPTITAIELVGGNVVIRGTNNNGATPGPVYILASTNLLLPLSNWTVLATNAFDGAGTLNFTNGAAGEAQQFYILQIP